MKLQSLVKAPVDAAIIANTFHGIPEQARFVEAVAAVLAPGGLFAIINWHKRPREETVVLDKPRGPKTDMRMSPAEVEAVVKQGAVEMELVDVIELPPYHYAALFRYQPKGK